MLVRQTNIKSFIAVIGALLRSLSPTHLGCGYIRNTERNLSTCRGEHERTSKHYALTHRALKSAIACSRLAA